MVSCSTRDPTKDRLVILNRQEELPDHVHRLTSIARLAEQATSISWLFGPADSWLMYDNADEHRATQITYIANNIGSLR